ncbi:MAG: hypothetical protein ACP5EN_10000, partial [Rhodovulum sp.]
MLKKLTMMPISRRLPVVMVLIVAGLSISMGAFLYQRAYQMQYESTRTTLNGLAEDQAAFVADWFENTAQHLKTTAATPLVATAVGEFDVAIRADGGTFAA